MMENQKHYAVRRLHKYDIELPTILRFEADTKLGISILEIGFRRKDGSIEVQKGKEKDFPFSIHLDIGMSKDINIKFPGPEDQYTSIVLQVRDTISNEMKPDIIEIPLNNSSKTQYRETL